MNALALSHPRLNRPVTCFLFPSAILNKTPILFSVRPRLSRPEVSSAICRRIYRYAKIQAVGTASSRIANDPSLNERIGPLRAFVHLVDETGVIKPVQLLGTILEYIDRPKEHLRRVGESEDGTPVCKIVTQESLIWQQRLDDISLKRKDVSEAAKQIELTWSISENDLGHRLKRVQEFLREGRRVEVMIAPKKRGRKVEKEETRTLVQQVENAVKEIEGAGEWKATVGTPGKQLEMYFMGPVEGDAALREKDLDKIQQRMKRKEAEERERKEKEEKRQRRKQEQSEQKAKLAASL